MFVDEIDQVIHFSLSFVFHGLIVRWHHVNGRKAGHVEATRNIIDCGVHLSDDEIRLASVLLSEFAVRGLEIRAMSTPKLDYMEELVETSARRLERGLLPFLWQHYRNISGHTRGYFGDDRIPPTRRGS